MFKVIDNLDDKTGWSTTDGSITVLEYETTAPGPKELYIAGGLSKSTLIRFEGLTAQVNQSAQKTLSFPTITDYDFIVLNLVSMYKGRDTFSPGDSPIYHISFGAGHDFFLPATKQRTSLMFRRQDGATFDKIKVTCLHSDYDVLSLSYLVAHTEETELDLQLGIINGIQAEIDDEQFSLGTASGTAGDNFLNLSKNHYLRELMAVKIGNDELKVKNVANKQIKFYEKQVLSSNYVSEPVYLKMPVYQGARNYVAGVPGIAVWSFPASRRKMTSEQEYAYDSFALDGTFYAQQEGYSGLFGFQIDILSFYPIHENYLHSAVRRFLIKQNLWAGGHLFEVEQIGEPQRIDDTLVDAIPKLSITVGISTQEQNTWDAIKILKTNFTDTITVDPRE